MPNACNVIQENTDYIDMDDSIIQVAINSDLHNAFWDLNAESIFLLLFINRVIMKRNQLLQYQLLTYLISIFNENANTLLCIDTHT